MALFWISRDDGFAREKCFVQVIDQAGNPVREALVSLAVEQPKSDTRWAEEPTALTTV
jgi:hypothetical protein